MCQVGTVIMLFPGCNHARQTGWQDSAVGTHLRDMITRCAACKPDQAFCGRLAIDDDSSSTASQSQPFVQRSAYHHHHRTNNALEGRCKFCASYESEIRLADHIKQTLMDYNMALLFDETRVAIRAEMERAFQYAVDEAVRAFGVDGKAREKALRTLDSGYQRASADISRLCGEKQLAPYRELYGR